MIVVRRADREIIRADPISEKDREKAWMQYIKEAGRGAIQAAIERGKQNERAV